MLFINLFSVKLQVAKLNESPVHFRWGSILGYKPGVVRQSENWKYTAEFLDLIDN